MGVQGGPQLALIPTVAQYAHQASTLSKQVWLHAYHALQVEEVRLEVTVVITMAIKKRDYAKNVTSSIKDCNNSSSSGQEQGGNF